MIEKTKSRPSIVTTQTAEDKPIISHAAFTSSKTLYNNSCDLSTVPRMRTIRETAQITGFPEYALRRLVKQNKIVCVQTGRKVLVNLDRFIDFLNGGEIY
jgi:hypothetical protein